LSETGIAFSQIISRVKDIDGFIEKIRRKNYDSPFEQMTDFAAARIVHLYADDMRKIDRIINDNFCDVVTDDKSTKLNPNEFEYRAVHYLVRLGDKHVGPRFDGISNLICEIQVRTVLQDAWAVMDHHLAYKKEQAFTDSLRRKLNSLAGLLETADDQFFHIREERDDILVHLEAVEAEAAGIQAQREMEWDIESARLDREMEKGN
jgi:putative GTP pyrophosphokinase